MTTFNVRIDEQDKSPAQLMQRERTYEAAKLLVMAGFPCKVVEYFTGDDQRADAAGIILDKE